MVVLPYQIWLHSLGDLQPLTFATYSVRERCSYDDTVDVGIRGPALSAFVIVKLPEFICYIRFGVLYV